MQYVRKKVRPRRAGTATQAENDIGESAVTGRQRAHKSCAACAKLLVFPCTPLPQEDPWNAIMAGALTGGFLQLRHGLKSAGQSALFGGFILVSARKLRAVLPQIPVPYTAL